MVANSTTAPASVASAASPEVSMSDLRRGSRGRVARVLGDTTESARLKALGLCEGRFVEILRTGDSWIVRVLGSRIGISRKLVSSVLVTAA